MAAAEPSAPTAPPAEPSGRKKIWALVVVAIIVVAALGTVAFVLLSAPAPVAPSLNRVTVTSSGGTTPYQGTTITLSAVSVDTSNVAQTANSTFAWSASPAAAVQLTSAVSSSSIRVSAVRGGPVTVYANATWKGVSKSGSIGLTVTPLSFFLSASDYHPLVRRGNSPSSYNPSVPIVTNVTVTLRAAVTPTNATYVNYQGTVHFTSTDAAATLPPDLPFTLANAGLNTANVIITVPGAVTVTATDTVFPIAGSTILYGNSEPVASFTLTSNPADPRIIAVDGSGSFDPDTGQTLTYSWAFGDGGIAVGVTASHTYSAARTYDVTLTVTDNWGALNVSTPQKHTVHLPPTAAFSIKSESPNGANILVWADATPSTGGDGTIVYYNWTWGDGTYNQVTTALAAHNYSSSWNGRTVTITLRVGSNYALTSTTSRNVLVTTAKVPPVATFTYSYVAGPIVNRKALRTLSVNASQSSSPTSTALLYYNWSWGDGSARTNLTGPLATHAYMSDGNYVVNLTVIDANGLKGYYQITVTISVPASPPNALFAVTRTKLSVRVDANASWDSNNNIAYYNWTWGDGATSYTNTTNPWAAHTYAAAGLYTITLTIWDTTNLKGTVIHYASVALSTVDYNFWDFFNVPYGEWWDFRGGPYGDRPINANCFNATSIADGFCKVSNPGLDNASTYPYTDWYPAPFGSLFYHLPGNDPFIYAPYRFAAVGASVPGYNLSEPVFLPVMNYGAPIGTTLTFNWNMQYLDVATANMLTTPTRLGGPGCTTAIAPTHFDGFMIRSQIYLTMDAQEARRIFGLPATATTPAQIQTWFNGQINPACATSGPLETAFTNALAAEGNGKYDVWNSFQFPYTPFYTNMSLPVVGTGADPMIHLTIDMTAWATEVLMARWFYWGNASYQANYLDSTKAKGWWGMELAWFEDFHFVGDLNAAAMNFSLRTVMEYHFQMGSAKGPDGTYHSSTNSDADDVPYWVWGPWLTDYVTSSNSHPTSELTRWNGLTYFHSTPGGINYGLSGPYDYAPLAWPPKYGETWHFLFPPVMRFYDPVRSPIPSNPQGNLQYWSNAPTGVAYDLWQTTPPNFGTYNSTLWTWDTYGNWSAAWPPGWQTVQNKPGSYPIIPWGSIYFKPLGSRPAFAQAVVNQQSGSPANLVSSVEGRTVAGSPALLWAVTAIAAPARTKRFAFGTTV